MLENSMSRDEIASVVLDVLSVSYNVPSTRLLAAMRNRAAVNNVEILQEVGCFSHTINLVRKHFKVA